MGAEVGALASIPFIEGEGSGTRFGTDEQTVALFALGGGGLAGIFVWNNRHAFSARKLSVIPALPGKGQYALLARMSLNAP